MIRRNRHRALTYYLSMISAQTRSALVARESRYPPIGSQPEGMLFRIMLVAGFHQPMNPFEPRDRIERGQQVLLVLEGQGDVRADDVRDPSGIVDMVEQRRRADVAR